MRNVLRRVTTLCLIVIMPAAWGESITTGLENSLGNLYRRAPTQSRSTSAENFTGERGKAGMATEGEGMVAWRNLGQDWKISSDISINPRMTYTLREVSSSGAIEHLWMTTDEKWWRSAVLRILRNDETEPSVETPLGEFFAMRAGRYAPVRSLPIAVNPGNAFNSY